MRTFLGTRGGRGGGRGGEGIVLKHRRAAYKPGTQSRSRWKEKQRLLLTVEILARADELVPWGDWGLACVMAFAYAHLSPAHLRAAVERLEGPTATPAAAPTVHKSAQNAREVDSHRASSHNH